MDEPWSPTPPPMPPATVRYLTWIMPCVGASMMVLAAAWMGYDPWDSARRILLIQVAYLIGWFVLTRWFKPSQADGMFWIVQGGAPTLLNPHLSLTRAFSSALATAVIVAIINGTIGRRCSEKVRRYLGPSIRPKTPEELARWRQDHPRDDRTRGT